MLCPSGMYLTVVPVVRLVLVLAVAPVSTGADTYDCIHWGYFQHGAIAPTSPKPGNGGLKLIEAVSNLIGDEGIIPKGGGAGVGGSATAAKRYCDAWNRRGMADAALLFAEDCVVRDL